MKILNEYKGLRKEIYILFFGKIMTSLGSMIWPIFTLILKDKLGYDATTIAVFMAIFTIVSIPVSLFGGKITDKFNKKNIIVFCDIVSVVAYFISAFVPISIVTVILFLIASLFQTIEYPAYDSLTADFSKSTDRDRAYSLLYFGGNLGLILAPTIGGILLHNYLYIAFIINACAILSSTLLIFFKLKNVTKEAEDEKSGNMYETAIDTKSSTLKFLFSHRVLVLNTIVVALYSAVYAMYNYLMPIELSNIFGEKGSTIFGTFSSVNCITVVCLTTVITNFFKKRKDVEKMWLGQVLVVVGLIVFTIFKEYIALGYVAMVIFTIGEILDAISASPFLTKRIPSSHRGRLLSINLVVNSLFQSVSNILIGKSYDTYGSNVSWTIVFIMGFVSIVVLTIMGAIDKKDYPELNKIN